MEQRIIEESNSHSISDESDGELGPRDDEDASTLHYKDLTLGREVCVYPLNCRSAVNAIVVSYTSRSAR